ncbi:MAG: DUF1015 domain-containing protein [Vicinamibacteria bacterium]|nr:DUF1015 domain-containing protein [Vicinamibacteria bacterium]
MPEIRPFHAHLYRCIAEPTFADVLAPPYDVISSSHAETLAARHPNNVVRLILNREQGESGYARAGDLYRRWLFEGVCKVDSESALYLLEQRFTLDGTTLARRGVLARFRAEDPATGTIRPHEHTRREAREDRYKILKATRANFGPIFMMFPDPEAAFEGMTQAIFSSPPTTRFEDDEHVKHRLWRVTHGDRIADLQSLLAGVPAYIADGHHRHATALRYRDETGPDGAWTLGYFTPSGAPGLVVLPYHRILRGGLAFDAASAALQECCELTPSRDVRAAASAIARSSAPYAFAMANGAGRVVSAASGAEARRFLPDDAPECLRALDVFFLDRAVLPLLAGGGTIEYLHALEAVEALLAGDPKSLAFIMRATPIAQITAVADARESMPPKSTYFHPKLPSGLVIHPLVKANERNRAAHA